MALPLTETSCFTQAVHVVMLAPPRSLPVCLELERVGVLKVPNVVIPVQGPGGDAWPWWTRQGDSASAEARFLMSKYLQYPSVRVS
eukprot:CAMPEP_0206242660 /NCGR_PEP_ID=MMETSP0047_2-20121206/17180_1 /ASSEMBLY_ACC=CAM_ASM_000192 /TAXON_ID=195065 /ORGANISM="Chroomonas mesostigmatica_cf, Strain CCMP1168" /LENGTH=85 /DNA_ID=CAMNT_0053667703 /DNA_START=264 /DNA_END=521 /DNA_ORIENTATION=+